MQKTFAIGKTGSGTDLGTAALEVFKGVEVTYNVPDAGTTPEETWANILTACGGDHVNARNVFVGQAANLTIQKAIKEECKRLAPMVLATRAGVGSDAWNKLTPEQIAEFPEGLTQENAVQILVNLANGPLPKHTPRGEGTGTPRAKSVKAAVDQEKQRQADTFKAGLEKMSEAKRRDALKLIQTLNPELYELVTAEEGDEGDEEE